MEATQMMPAGWKWDRRWYSLARLTHDGQVIGEAQIYNGTCIGTVGGRMVCSSIALDVENAVAAVMGQVVEVAIRMA